MLEIGRVTVVAPSNRLDLAIALAEMADRPATWPGLGSQPLAPLRLILVPDSAAMDAYSRGRAPAWGAGIALPDSRTILLRVDAGDVFRTLRHELAHLALHQAVRVRLPLWFDEGYAGWAAGEFDRLDGLRLNLTVIRGALPELDRLDAELRGAPASLDAAYALATSAVLELARRNPEGSLHPLLSRLRDGENFEAAVRATTGLSLSRFEVEWLRTLRRRYSVFTWIVGGGAWALLGLLLWALTWYRRRADRPRRAALDQGWDLPPDGDDPPALDPGVEAK